MGIKNKELRSLSESEIEKKLVELRLELMKLLTQVATGIVPKNPSQIKNVKKLVARMLQQLYKIRNKEYIEWKKFGGM